MDLFLKKILEFCSSRELLASGRLLAGVSGGADSVALLFALKQFKDRGLIGCDIFAGHINHNLRGVDSDGDECFVKEFAKELELECITKSVDVKGYARENRLSTETAARELRIKNLLEIADSLGCGQIATAHHADDNSETIVYRLKRGTGFKGLCGISPRKEFEINGYSAKFVRPLLGITKNELLEYCNRESIRWRHDHTNDELDFTRNKIRHLVIPYLQRSTSTNLCENLNELSDNCQKLFERIEKKIADLSDQLFLEMNRGNISINVKIVKKLSPVVQVEVIRMAMVKIGCGQRYINRSHYNQVISLLAGEGGKAIELPGRFMVRFELGNLVLYPPAESLGNLTKEKIEIKFPGTVEFGGYQIKTEIFDSSECDLDKFINEKYNTTEWFDMDKIKGPIYARKRKQGDRFIPIGMKSEKKIGKFLTDEKVDYQLRKKLILIENKNRVIWVGPIRASEETRVDESTTKILSIELI